MTKPVKRVAVTGAAGQIAYNLLFRIASGEMLGWDQPVALHLLEVAPSLEMLKGVVMELEDCAFPLLQEITFGTDAREIFKNIDIALLIGSKPRGPGMERKELLTDNGKIFIEQGKALNDAAAPHALVFVVGNPCNTNALIAMHHAPKLPRSHFFAMTRLDQNRAASFLASKAGAPVREVSRVTIWGNHSSTQVPDYFNAQIRGHSAAKVIDDKRWLQEEFIPKVQKRGAAVIAARGKSSAASAAHAVIGSIQSLIQPTAQGEWFSCGICSDGNPYGIHKDLIFSFPCRSKGWGKIEIVRDLQWDDFLQQKIKLSEEELLEEKKLVQHLI